MGKEEERKVGAVCQVEAAFGSKNITKDAGPVVSELHIDDGVSTTKPTTTPINTGKRVAYSMRLFNSFGPSQRNTPVSTDAYDIY